MSITVKFRNGASHRIGLHYLLRVVVLSLCLAYACATPSLSEARASGSPIVIGYIGTADMPGTKSNVDIQKMAEDEINAAGGILGRPVRLVFRDSGGNPVAATDALRELIIGMRAELVTVETRPDIARAVMEASGRIVGEYPHFLVFNGSLHSELASRILEDAPAYDHCFSNGDPIPAMEAQWRHSFCKTIPTYQKARKIAFLWDTHALHSPKRQVTEATDQPLWEAIASECGLDVVYRKALAPRGTSYLPILEDIARSDAQLIYFFSSPQTDTDSFARQWAVSAARDIPVNLQGGMSQTRHFWKMTGGAALGIVSVYTDMDDLTLTEQTIPFARKARARKIPLQDDTHTAYAGIYHFKAAVEKAGALDDPAKLIAAMENVETVYSLGKLKYETRKIKPFYHSRMRVDAQVPSQTYPGFYEQVDVQFQSNGKIVYLHAASPESEARLTKRLTPSRYLTPFELRKISGKNGNRVIRLKGEGAK